MTDVLRIGPITFEAGDNWCRTTLADGSELVAMPEDTDAYYRTAAKHGYGGDINRLCIEHELVHHLLARWLGLPESYALGRVARGNLEATDISRMEEQAVLSIQAFANAVGAQIRDAAG